MFCECGTELVGRQTVRCRECAMIADSGTSQCPFCGEWYYSHGGKGTESAKWFHAKRECRKGK